MSLEKTIITHQNLRNLYQEFQFHGDPNYLKEILYKNYFEPDNQILINEIPGVENSTYLVICESKKYVLRIYRQNKKNYQDITQEVEFINDLRACNQPVPKIFQAYNFNYICEFKFVDKTWYCVLMEFIDGSHLSIYTNDLITDIARFLAFAHIIRPASKRQIIQPIVDVKYLLKNGDFGFSNYQKNSFIDRALKYKTHSQDLPCGYIHSDLHGDNFITNSSNRLKAIIDFDDANYLPFVYDLGAILWSVWSNTKSLEMINLFIETYNKKRSLTSKELKVLKNYIHLRNYYFGVLEYLSFGNTTFSHEFQSYQTMETEIEEYIHF